MALIVFPNTRYWMRSPPDEPVLRETADILYGMTLGRRGEIDRAAQVTLQCIQREKKPHGRLAIPTLVPFLARIYLMQGRLHRHRLPVPRIPGPDQGEGQPVHLFGRQHEYRPGRGALRME